MDAFEARLEFSKKLFNLIPSSVIISSCVNFALRYCDYQDDFNSCIIEVLSQVDLNQKLNILYFIEALLLHPQLQINKDITTFPPYLLDILRALPNYLITIIPSHHGGLSNLRVAFSILQNIGNNFLTLDPPIDLDKNTDKNLENFSSDLNLLNSLKISNDSLNKNIHSFDNLNANLINNSNTQKETKINYEDIIYQQFPVSGGKILARMELDRERHKKLKESKWMVNRLDKAVDKNEFRYLWDKYDELSDDDIDRIEELNDLARDSYNYPLI
ncbi:Ctk3p ASCRUDRAFT_34500 [Ascoidea rubescens DSM 1968]|uniref:CID domain-containing protein n=1 Tax=Ascoidea rubescens DSM 1968 TaxID=1344418 RepID=A0A1D2VI14_9ASCO|nr:hypothetical protein ASCRUDRAFT_34500 [Ascoidea rubescens DSM 1968]ODV61278.1 hypothetical protein ASCRUDRAFT_34500 [Ascoidea rubescens DSM 1968]